MSKLIEKIVMYLIANYGSKIIDYLKDLLFDYLEELAQSTENELDDEIIRKIREAFDKVDS